MCVGRKKVLCEVDCVWNVMAHAQKTDFVFWRNGRVHLNRWRRQVSRLLAAEVCALAVVMLDTPCSEVVWRVLATHCIRQFPIHFTSSAPPPAITFQLGSTACLEVKIQGWPARLSLRSALKQQMCCSAIRNFTLDFRLSPFSECSVLSSG